jgi:quinoprotein glucose dehydrogenase
MLETLRNEGIFTPPSLEGSVQFPGTAGGVNWGSVAFDPERQLLVLAQNRIAQSHRIIPRADAPASWKQKRPRGVAIQEGTPYFVKQEVILSPLGIPCTPPPWGTLMAVDLRTGQKRWEIPFGTVRRMLPIPISWTWGLPSMGGPIVTASGLVFVGAAMDDYFRAYDSETGEELWRFSLPAGGQATPMTYRLREDGRQYVVIAAGGHSTLGTTLGDWLMAFALPD